MATTERRALGMNEAEQMFRQKFAEMREAPDEGQADAEPQAAEDEDINEILDDAVAEFDAEAGSDSDNSDEEPDPSAAAEDEAEEGAAKEEQELFEVATPEGPIEVTAEELRSGYLRQQDYSRKTAEVAEQRKTLEAEQSAFLAEREQVRQMLGQLEQLEYGAAEEPDWVELARTVSPQEFNARKAEWERSQNERATIRAERERQEAEVRRALEAQRQQRVEQELEHLGSVIPDWSDHVDGWIETAAHYGYTPDEVAAVEDHRALRLLHDAMQYRRVQAETPRIKRKAKSPSIDPGRATPPSERVTREEREIQNARERFRQRGGRPSDASALIEKYLSAQRRRAK